MGMTIPRGVFVRYHSYAEKIDTAIETARKGENFTRVVQLKDLRRSCYPTMEEVVEKVESFFGPDEVPLY